VANLETVVPICNQGGGVPKIIIGGHSATGGVAWNCSRNCPLHQTDFWGWIRIRVIPSKVPVPKWQNLTCPH
jgi:hypothetical protein